MAIPREPASWPEPTRRAEPLWLQPYPDALLDDLPDTEPGPEARYERREAVALAFVTGLQRLPPRQRAVLVLRDVLGYPAAQAAGMLGASELSVNSALQRARATLAGFFQARTAWRTSVSRLVPTRANHQPAFGYYRADPPGSVPHAHGLIVLTLAGGQICAITRFGDDNLFPHFGLPPTLPHQVAGAQEQGRG